MPIITLKDPKVSKPAFPPHALANRFTRRVTHTVLRAALLLLTLVACLGHAHALTLGWDANPEGNIAGYRLYYHPTSGTEQVLDVGASTTATVNNLTAGVTYSFHVSAYNTDNLEGPGSDEISYTAPVDTTPSAQVAGKYLGLIKPVTGDVQGLFTMTLNASGKTTGRITLGTLNYAWKAVPLVDGQMTVHIRRGRYVSDLVLTLQVSPVSGQVTGTITDGLFSSTFSAEAPTYKAITAEAVQKGKYTVVLSPGNEVAPQGYGSATMTVSNLGVAKVVGTLADGTKFSLSSTVGASGTCPVYLFLYKKAGLLSGDVAFRNIEGASDADSSLTWKKSASDASALHFEAARYAYTAGSSVLPGLTETAGKLRLTIASQAGTPVQDEPFALNASNKLFLAKGENTESVVLSLNPTNGTFSGSFRQSGIKVPIRGVLYQKGAGEGAGWFQNATQSGKVTLAPSL
jgi:hypothetical protein